MNLANLIAREANVQLDEVMLLRHGNSITQELHQHGGTIEEYTLIQPANTKYDFLAAGKPPIEVVVVIVNDCVNTVYRILGVQGIGTTHTLGTRNLIQFNIAKGYSVLPAKFFIAEQLPSAYLGRPVHGWTCPRTPVARHGGRVFDRIEI